MSTRQALRVSRNATRQVTKAEGKLSVSDLDKSDLEGKRVGAGGLYSSISCCVHETRGCLTYSRRAIETGCKLLTPALASQEYAWCGRHGLNEAGCSQGSLSSCRCAAGAGARGPERAAGQEPEDHGRHAHPRRHPHPEVPDRERRPRPAHVPPGEPCFFRTCWEHAQHSKRCNACSV
jgi:hypothetical protein